MEMPRTQRLARPSTVKLTSVVAIWSTKIRNATTINSTAPIADWLLLKHQSQLKKNTPQFHRKAATSGGTPLFWPEVLLTSSSDALGTLFEATMGGGPDSGAGAGVP